MCKDVGKCFPGNTAQDAVPTLVAPSVHLGDHTSWGCPQGRVGLPGSTGVELGGRGKTVKGGRSEGEVFPPKGLEPGP